MYKAALKGWLKNAQQYTLNTTVDSKSSMLVLANAAMNGTKKRCSCYTAPLTQEKQAGPTVIILDCMQCPVHKKALTGSAMIMKTKKPSYSMTMETTPTKSSRGPFSFNLPTGAASTTPAKADSPASTKSDESSSPPTVILNSGREYNYGKLFGDESRTSSNSPAPKQGPLKKRLKATLRSLKPSKKKQKSAMKAPQKLESLLQDSQEISQVSKTS